MNLPLHCYEVISGTDSENTDDLIELEDPVGC